MLHAPLNPNHGSAAVPDGVLVDGGTALPLTSVCQVDPPSVAIVFDAFDAGVCSEIG